MDLGIFGGGDINPAGGLGALLAPQWGPEKKLLATKLDVILHLTVKLLNIHCGTH